MPRIDWPWNKTFTIQCPDGTERLVYKNIDEIFPIFLKEVRASASAALKAADHISGEAAAQYDDKIAELLFRIDDFNKSSQIQLRSSYIVFQSSPCTKLEYLEAAFDDIRRREHSLRSADMVVKGILSALKNPIQRGEDDNLAAYIGEGLDRAIDMLSERPSGKELVENMSAVPQIAEQWRRSDGQ